MLNGLVQINVELSSRCNKACWMCGRRKRERELGDQNYGDIDFSVLETIASQCPKGLIVALHNNGDSFLYPRLHDAIKLFKGKGCHVYMVTNGKLLMEKRDDILYNLDQVSVSVIENDEEWEKELQYKILRQFIASKSYLDKPLVVLRFVGDIKDEQRYIDLGLPIVKRTIHKPEGSFGYRNEPMKPEFLVCWDLISRMTINRYGTISLCVRFDPTSELVLGNVKEMTLDTAWNSTKRLNTIDNMICGKRIDFCGKKCTFWGIPTK